MYIVLFSEVECILYNLSKTLKGKLWRLSQLSLYGVVDMGNMGEGSQMSLSGRGMGSFKGGYLFYEWWSLLWPFWI